VLELFAFLVALVAAGQLTNWLRMTSLVRVSRLRGHTCVCLRVRVCALRGAWRVGCVLGVGWCLRRGTALPARACVRVGILPRRCHAHATLCGCAALRGTLRRAARCARGVALRAQQRTPAARQRRGKRALARCCTRAAVPAGATHAFAAFRSRRRTPLIPLPPARRAGGRDHRGRAAGPAPRRLPALPQARPSRTHTDTHTHPHSAFPRPFAAPTRPRLSFSENALAARSCSSARWASCWRS
jgi:hypothetical protein